MVGAFFILENYRVKNIVIGIQAEEYENCVRFIELARKKNVKIIVLQAGNVLKIDRNTYFETFFPDSKNTILDNKINNNSLVLKLKYKEFSMLFTGDIEKLGENAITEKYGNELNSTILKVAHHGSKTSSTQIFLQSVQPKIALIGVGENNNFGHPNEEVLKRFQNLRN